MIRVSAPIVILMTFLFLPSNSRASERTVNCSHPKVCQLVNVIAPELNVKIERSLEKLEGDPHHTQMTLGQMKELIQAEVLVTPSFELQSWLPKVIKNRKTNKTFTLKIKENGDLTTREKRILAHFWLYPRQTCHNIEGLANFLKEQFPDVSQEGKKRLLKTCNKFIHEIYEVLSNFTKSKNSPPVILTHDALSLLFNKFEIETLSLSGSGHGESFGTKEFKRLKKLIKESPNSPLLWVLEEGLHSTAKVKRMTRPVDKVITINTSGYGKKSRDIFAPLRKLIDFLREINEQGEKK